MLTHSTEQWESHLVLESSLCQPVDVEPALNSNVSMTGQLPSRYYCCSCCHTCASAADPLAAAAVAYTVLGNSQILC